jgi:hypothetical protein
MSPHNHPLKTTLALTLALGAIAPTAASARVDLNSPPAGFAINSPPAKTTQSPQPAVQIVRLPAPGGFDWGDAGIGAAGGFGLSMLAIGGGLVITQRRDRRTSGPAAVTS